MFLPIKIIQALKVLVNMGSRELEILLESVIAS